jgi:hypothetical protein
MFLPRRGLGARGAWFCALGLMLAGAGCEPASITDAHNQLGRAPQRIVSLAIPIIDTTETPTQFLGADTAATPQGLLGIKINQSIAVGVGNKIRFDNVHTSPVYYTMPGGILSTPGTDTLNTNYTLLNLEPRLTAIDTVVADSGHITLTTSNRLSVPVTVTTTLNDFLDSTGATLAVSQTIPAAPGNGNWTSSTVTVSLAGVTILPPVANADLAMIFTVPAGGIAPGTLADSAITQSGTGTIAARRLAGPLDPAKTPELNVAARDSQQIDSTQFNLGDLQNAFDSVSLAKAQLTVTFGNTSSAPLVLSGFTLRVDSAGTTISVPVADSGATTLTLARDQVGKVVTLPAGHLLNALVHLALAGRSVTLLAVGTAVVGDGQPSTIRNTDQVSVGGLTVGLDFVIPAAGVSFTRTAITSGADLGTKDADQIAQHVDTAAATALVTNHTPFGVRVQIALVDDTLLLVNDTLRSTVTADSLFKRSDRVDLASVSLKAAPVDALGRVTGAVQDTATVALTGAQSLVLLGKKIIAGIRFTLVPSDSTGRGGVTPTDQVGIHASGSVKLRSGGTP